MSSVEAQRVSEQENGQASDQDKLTTIISISEAVSKVISPDAGSQSPLTAEDNKLIEEYQKAALSHPSELQFLAFKNIIKTETTPTCGFAGSGSYQYLVNTDTGNSYKVTVRTQWQQGSESGYFDKVYTSPAGTKIRLGCTVSGNITGPKSYYTRQVVGEMLI
ncbi:MAG: hypothetical protein MET45_28360 [Nostoc sp. LLA-1]|nr:hypothetical protein [Cyanocohniella sp. LLY]